MVWRSLDLTEDEYALIEAIRRTKQPTLRKLGRPIADLPNDHSSVLARTDDGRVVVWQAAMLHSLLTKPASTLLTFPATQWIPLTDIPW